MRPLTPAGQQALDDLARRHGFSQEATLAMLEAVLHGNGRMAQFNHPGLGGSGQWMRGGMTMVGDMFDHGLKKRVDALCMDLATLVADEPGLLREGSFQSQRQGGSDTSARSPTTQDSPSAEAASLGSRAEPQHAVGGGSTSAAAASSSGTARPEPARRGSLFEAADSDHSASAHGDWWPAELGRPHSTGAQNGMRYAVFGDAHRLAIDEGGRVTVYDTLDHRIGGASQQQSGSSRLSFSSQHGPIELDSLPVVGGAGDSKRAGHDDGAKAMGSGTGTSKARLGTSVGEPQSVPADRDDAPPRAEHAAGAPPERGRADGGSEHDRVLATLERLADLRGKGILSDDEFAAKKAELLKRL